MHPTIWKGTDLLIIHQSQDKGTQTMIEIVDMVDAHDCSGDLDSRKAHPTVCRAILANDSNDGVKMLGYEGDYRLLPGSPGIGTGVAQDASGEDIEGRTRDSLPDLGANEMD